MDLETFDQFELPVETAGELTGYMPDGSEVEILLFEDRPIGVSLPIKVTLTVTETPPGFKGDTAARSYKPATVETGATVQVPFFIKPGERIVVDTRDGSYVERA